MADANKLAELLKALADEGYQFSDINKALKGAKDAGIIKSAGRGKAPENDPMRLAFRDALVATQLTVNEKVDGKDVTKKISLMDALKDLLSDATSFMATLDDNFKVNFIKNMPKEKKEKQDKKAEGPKSFEEPAVAVS